VKARADKAQAENDRARETALRAAWEELPEAERAEITAAVKAANPGISRWRAMLESLCLSALEARQGSARQKRLFSDGEG
jgi:hypothetical protein